MSVPRGFCKTIIHEDIKVERERERESVCVCVCEREIEREKARDGYSEDREIGEKEREEYKERLTLN